MIRSNALVSLVSFALAVSLGGCHLQATEGDLASEDVRGPRICPAIAILCEDGYEARRVGNCNWTCVPSRGDECQSDTDCTIYCITAPCPVGVCERGRCGIADEEPSACAAVLCAEGTQCVESRGRARCVAIDRCGDGMAWNTATGACECTAMARCASGWSWDPIACECLSPCASVRCAAGTHCVANEDGSAVCAPDATACVRTGCSGQVCADGDVVTTCEWREEYACYASASCERQADGACGWTETPELAACLGGV